MSFYEDHPELEDDEFFCMNIPEYALQWILWDSKRLGNYAYDDDGQLLGGLKPLFVKKEEVVTRYGLDYTLQLFGSSQTHDHNLVN